LLEKVLPVLYIFFCLLSFGCQAGHLRLVKPYMVAVQSNDVAAVNEALNEIYIEEEDYDRLRESIDLHDNFDHIGLAQKVRLKSFCCWKFLMGLILTLPTMQIFRLRNMSFLR
jgi:hypothetical protein